MKIYKFVFKTNKFGKWDRYSTVDIKYNGMEIGTANDSQDGKWTISLKAPASEKALANNPNCPWMWIKVKQLFDTKEDARAWLNDNRETVLSKIYFE